MREERTEVLVVGAGPVGLWTALLLAEAGVETIIIDREEHTTARSYACALHPQTLARLQRLGLAQALLEQGRRVPRSRFMITRPAALNSGSPNWGAISRFCYPPAKRPRTPVENGCAAPASAPVGTMGSTVLPTKRD